MKAKRRPRYALWGHRANDWTPGYEPILTTSNRMGFGPWEPVRVLIQGAAGGTQSLWVLLR